MIVLQTLMSFPEMTSLFKLGPLIINEAKSHHMVPSLVLPNAGGALAGGLGGFSPPNILAKSFIVTSS